MRKSAFQPCIPTRGTKVPDRPEWIHEIKHDGYRLIVQRILVTAIVTRDLVWRYCPLGQ
jgi:ATP-dependent DNA ligase